MQDRSGSELLQPTPLQPLSAQPTPRLQPLSAQVHFVSDEEFSSPSVLPAQRLQPAHQSLTSRAQPPSALPSPQQSSVRRQAEQIRKRLHHRIRLRSTTSTQRRTCAKDEQRALLVENESRRHNDEIHRQTQLIELNNRAVAVQEAILEEHKNTNALLALFQNEHQKTNALMERAVTAFEKYVEKL